jgi:hypothetical protein
VSVLSTAGWRRIRTDHFDAAHAAFAIPEKQDQANGEQGYEATNQQNNCQQRADTCGSRWDIK